MANIKFKFYNKKFERQLVRELAKSAVVKRGRYANEDNNMVILSKMEEEAFQVIIKKYDGNPQHVVSGSYDEFPDYMLFSIGKIFKQLETCGYIASNLSHLSGWNVVLTPDGISYFEDKGMRNELFNELPDNAKELLRELIDAEDNGHKTDQILINKVENASNDSVIRGVIGDLTNNGLLKVSWADDLPMYNELTNSGRTYFEREAKYLKEIEHQNKPGIHIETLNANGSNIVLGNAINSTFNIDNSIHEIERRIEEHGGEDKEDLKELLEEAKEILENFESTKTIQPRKGFMKKLSRHLEKNQWFYGAITTMLGEVTIKLLMG